MVDFLHKKAGNPRSPEGLRSISEGFPHQLSTRFCVRSGDLAAVDLSGFLVENLLHRRDG